MEEKRSLGVVAADAQKLLLAATEQLRKSNDLADIDVAEIIIQAKPLLQKIEEDPEGVSNKVSADALEIMNLAEPITKNRKAAKKTILPVRNKIQDVVVLSCTRTVAATHKINLILAFNTAFNKNVMQDLNLQSRLFNSKRQVGLDKPVSKKRIRPRRERHRDEEPEEEEVPGPAGTPEEAPAPGDAAAISFWERMCLGILLMAASRSSMPVLLRVLHEFEEESRQAATSGSSANTRLSDFTVARSTPESFWYCCAGCGMADPHGTHDFQGSFLGIFIGTVIKSHYSVAEPPKFGPQI